MAISVETFFLNPDAEGTLQAKIQQMIAQGILSGRFRKGEKLPSTRKLARHLGVSRITVTMAYTELLANDYLDITRPLGLFRVPQRPRAPPDFDALAPRQDAVDWSRAIGRRFTGGDTPRSRRTGRATAIPFIYGQADPDAV